MGFSDNKKKIEYHHPVNLVAIEVHKETYSISNFASCWRWRETGTELKYDKKSEYVTKGILRTLDLPSATTLAFVGVSLGVSALWLRRRQAIHQTPLSIQSSVGPVI